MCLCQLCVTFQRCLPAVCRKAHFYRFMGARVFKQWHKTNSTVKHQSAVETTNQWGQIYICNSELEFWWLAASQWAPSKWLTGHSAHYYTIRVPLWFIVYLVINYISNRCADSHYVNNEQHCSLADMKSITLWALLLLLALHFRKSVLKHTVLGNVPLWCHKGQWYWEIKHWK